MSLLHYFARCTLVVCCTIAPYALASVETSVKVVHVATSIAPPYMIVDGDTGIDIDITRAALAEVGYDMRVSYMTLKKAFIRTRAGVVDATVPIFASAATELHISDPHVYYRPTVFSLKNRKLKVDRIDDLGNFSVATFQGAKGYLGPFFASAVDSSPIYHEHNNMTLLVSLLLSGRTDLVVLDYNIFQYFLHQIPGPSRRQLVHPHAIFKPVTANVGFYQQALRDDFNRGLRKIKSNGVYQHLMDGYQQYGIDSHQPTP